MPLSPIDEASTKVTFVATDARGAGSRGADLTAVAQLDATELEALLNPAGRIKAGRRRRTPLAAGEGGD
jgi:hypothetical protein